jgi:two-component system, NtrC family, nitrogen regulation sensor histidine kinase GlnL
MAMPAESRLRDRSLPPMFAILGALPRAVIVVDESRHIVMANAMAEEFFQMGASVLERHTLADIVPFASPMLALVEKVQRQGWTVHEYDLDLSTPRTGERHADVLGAPIQEMPGAAVLLFEARSLAEKMGRNMWHRGAARSVSGMAAVLAHEIKNPLAGIRGAAQLVETQVPDADRPLPQLIIQEADRIAKLVDKMASFGIAGTFDRAPVNIHDVLDHVHRLAASSFARGIQIVENYDPSLPPVHGDRDALVQVFLNLVRNAADALSNTEAPRIMLTTSFRPGVRLSTPSTRERLSLPLEVDVTDNGPGIDPDLMPHLFDPFVTTKPGGTGLGLALVAKIIDEHGGIVDCASRAGETSFRLLLPIEHTPLGAANG